MAEALAEGTPCWVDALLSDLGAGRRFYGALLGWTYGDPEPPERGSYTVARLHGEAVAALAHKRDGRMPTAWTVHFATPDAAATLDRVEAAGGRTVTEPAAFGALGTVATAVDPDGALFGLWQPGELRGSGPRHEPGACAWIELYTRRREAADAFYAEVFGYAAHPAGSSGGRGGGQDGSGIAVWTLSGGGPPVGGRSVLAGRYPAQMPPHFLVYFAVADCDEAVRRTLRLGGRTVHGPLDAPVGRHAVLTDDQGARFAVLEVPGSALPPGGGPAVPGARRP